MGDEQRLRSTARNALRSERRNGFERGCRAEQRDNANQRPCERRKSVPLLAAACTDTVIAELDHLTLGEITRQAAVRSALSNRHCDSTGPDRTLATGFSDILAEVSGKLVDVARELNKSQSSISYLWHTDWPDRQHRHILTREAAEKTGLELRSSGHYKYRAIE